MAQKCTDCDAILIFNQEDAVFTCPVDGTFHSPVTTLEILLHAIETKSVYLLDYTLGELLDNNGGNNDGHLEEFKDIKEVKDDNLTDIFNEFGWHWCDNHGYVRNECKSCAKCNVRGCNGCRGAWEYSVCSSCCYDDY